MLDLRQCFCTPNHHIRGSSKWNRSHEVRHVQAQASLAVGRRPRRRCNSATGIFCTGPMARRCRACWWLAWRWLAWRRLAWRRLAWRLGRGARRLGMARTRLGLGRRRTWVWRVSILFRLAARLSAGRLLSAARVLSATGLLSAGLPICLRVPERIHAQLLRLCQPAGDLYRAADLRTAGVSSAACARSEQLRDARRAEALLAPLTGGGRP